MCTVCTNVHTVQKHDIRKRKYCMINQSDNRAFWFYILPGNRIPTSSQNIRFNSRRTNYQALILLLAHLLLPTKPLSSSLFFPFRFLIFLYCITPFPV